MPPAAEGDQVPRAHHFRVGDQDRQREDQSLGSVAYSEISQRCKTNTCIYELLQQVPNFAQIAAPLHRLVGKSRKVKDGKQQAPVVPIHWEGKCEATLHELKRRLTLPPILRLGARKDMEPY